MTGWDDSEFAFELRVCRWAELAWERQMNVDGHAIVARQIGTKRRRWDTVIIECDPVGLAARSAFGSDELDSDLLDVLVHAPAEWTWYRDALDHPGYPWRYVRESIHRAADRGLLKTRKRGNRIEIKRIAPYPDWVNRIVAIENKPDLDASAARALSAQLTHDVRARLADEVWVATADTDGSVSPALLKAFPVEVGVLSCSFSDGVNADSTRVDWYPTAIRSDADREIKGGQRSVTKRLVLAERAYGRGFRSYHRTMRPDCRHFELKRDGRALLPACAAKGTLPTPRECSGSCPAFEPEPPIWRTRNYPIEGGPGKSVVRLLRERRRRQRERL
ncbi:DUF5787 family protein [Halalkalirubrum salinum]|uniref:DUF5787 family protein n=1 Tax=Halalkalirubrum salinum TaxID=2563889 RepID=UPI0010FB80AB|nr:DUF5787 family protein [Halalkalirubrum salinum]